MGNARKRVSAIKRETKETTIELKLALDGSGDIKLATPWTEETQGHKPIKSRNSLGFFEHMFTAMAKHSLFNIDLKASGDIQVDDHHTVEDLGLVLGEAFYKALGDKKGIRRFGSAFVPMDKSLARCTVDISGRPCLVYKVEILKSNRWKFDVNLVREFFQAFVNKAQITLHLELVYGDNYHHACEALFKAAGRALREAVEADPRVSGVPSSKGVL